MLLGGINPLGPKLLTFPIHLLGRQAILNHILEWQAPRFIIPGQRLFLLQVAVAALLLARRRNWVLGVSMAVFVPLALLSARNINVASLVLLMAMAPSARTERGLSGEQTARAATLGTPILLCFGLLMTLVSTTKPAVDLSGYPMKAVTWIDAHTDITAERIATQDVIGNFIELVGNGHIPVFVDDRADMFPEAVFEDSIKLLDADRSWAEVLNRYHVTLVLWSATSPLAAVLEASPNWHIVYEDDDWIVGRPPHPHLLRPPPRERNLETCLQDTNPRNVAYAFQRFRGLVPPRTPNSRNVAPAGAAPAERNLETSLHGHQPSKRRDLAPKVSRFRALHGYNPRNVSPGHQTFGTSRLTSEDPRFWYPQDTKPSERLRASRTGPDPGIAKGLPAPRRPFYVRVPISGP